MTTEEILFVAFLVVICTAAPFIYWISKREEERDEREFRERFKNRR